MIDEEYTEESIWDISEYRKNLISTMGGRDKFIYEYDIDHINLEINNKKVNIKTITVEFKLRGNDIILIYDGIEMFIDLPDGSYKVDGFKDIFRVIDKEILMERSTCEFEYYLNSLIEEQINFNRKLRIGLSSNVIKKHYNKIREHIDTIDFIKYCQANSIAW